MTNALALKLIRSFGMVATRIDGEWQINFRGASEGTAYFTDDTQDAVNTAETMALHAREHGHMSPCGRYPAAR